MGEGEGTGGVGAPGTGLLLESGVGGSEGEGFKGWELGEVSGKISVEQSSFQVYFPGSWSPLMGQHQDRAC